MESPAVTSPTPESQFTTPVTQPGPLSRRPDVAFGDIMVSPDYKGLEKVTPGPRTKDFLDQLNNLITSSHGTIWDHVKDLGADQQRWLVHALYLYARNGHELPKDFDHQAAAFRLIRRAARHSSMPGDADGAFEREALAASGWVRATLLSKLKPPTRQVSDELDRLYNPGGGDGRPLDPDLMRAELLPKLRKMLDEQVGRWLWPKGQKPLVEPLERVRGVADYIQTYVATKVGPYSTANPDGPYYDGFRYADRLQYSSSLPTDPDRQLSYMMNRAELIGQDEAEGGVLTKAGYDGNRPEDRAALEALMRDLLRDPDVAKQVVALLRLTGAHGEASISIPPIVPSPTWGNQQAWRWRLIRTLIHEFLHRLAHPDFTAKAAEIGHGQVVTEGFVDMITTDIFRALIKDIYASSELPERLLGDPDLQRPPRSTWSTSYGKAGASAEEIRKKVGDDAVHAAFFLGAVELVGLKKGAVRDVPAEVI